MSIENSSGETSLNRDRILISKFKPLLEQVGLKETIRRLFDAINTQAVYNNENNPEFSEMRKRLNTEPGLIISNHPGGFDAFAILMALERKDVKGMASLDVFRTITGIFGEENIIPAVWNEEHGHKNTKAPYENIKHIKTIINHIHSGGLFLLFPTGGRERKKFEFADLFRLLVEKMKDDEMIYSFGLTPSAKEGNIWESLRVLGAVSDASTGGLMNINKSIKPLILGVDEDYSVAKEWKEIIEDATGKGDKRDKLTKHYLEKFKDVAVFNSNRADVNKNSCGY